MKGKEITVGTKLIYQGKLCEATSAQHVKPGKGAAYMQVEMRDIKQGTKLTHRFNSDEFVEEAFITMRHMTLSYINGNNLVFVEFTNDGSVHEIEIDIKKVNINPALLIEDQEFNISFYNDQLIDIAWPTKAVIRATVLEAEHYIPGSTATQNSKPAVLQTANGGLINTKVRCHVTVGNQVEIDPTTMEFIRVISK